MARVLLIGILAAVIFWVVTVVDCAVQPAARHRGVSRGTWMVIVILLPVVGGILWFWIGRVRASTARDAAPDDDAAFLSSLNSARISAAEQDERIRRLEEELARLDEEEQPPAPSDEDPGDGSGDGDDSRDQHGARG